MQEIYNAEDIDHARVAVKAFKIDYGTKFPKAVEKITSEVDVLLEFYNYPAEHWIHLRTTNPIESTFSTVRLRTKVTKGPGSRMAGLAMAVRPAWAIAWGCESPGGRGGANSESEARASS